MSRAMRAAVLVCGLAGAAFLVTPAGAQAAADPGDEACNGRHQYDCDDPVDAGCSANATTVDSQTTSKGTFELRYSRSCSTNWVRVENYAGGSEPLYLYVEDSDRGVYAGFEAAPTRGLHYGNMVWSPAANCARGLVDYDNDIGYEVRLYSSTC
jgi:Protein of unknown function (DUF2690)